MKVPTNARFKNQKTIILEAEKKLQQQKLEQTQSKTKSKTQTQSKTQEPQNQTSPSIPETLNHIEIQIPSHPIKSVGSSYLGPRGYTILKDCIDAEEEATLRDDLTLGPYVPKAPVQPPKFPIYRECSSKIYIPRYYGIKVYGPPDESRIKDGDDVSDALVFNGDMRDYQIAIVDKYVSAATKSPELGGGGLLDVDPGKGKTVMALNIISRLRKKTLVIVHKSFLLNQWIERITQFLPNARVGTIQGPVMDIENKDIVIGMLQSLSMKEYPKSTFDSFGLSVYDECFPYYTLIHTSRGVMPIGELAEGWLFSSMTSAPKILSFNRETNEFEYKSMTHSWKKTTTELISLTLKHSLISCTPNHKILTNTGYVAAQDLEEGDLIVCMRENTSTGERFQVYDWIVAIKWNRCRGPNESIDVYDIEVADNHNFVLAKPDYGGSQELAYTLSPVVSNCHHMSAEVFCRCMMKVVTKYTLGLSGTMQRKDGLSKIFKYFLGDVIHKEKSESTHCVLVKGIQYKVDDDEFNETEYDFRGNPKFSTMITKISDYSARSEFILRVLENELAINNDQQIMILAHNKSLLSYLYKAIDYRGIASVGYYIGGMKEAALKESESKKVIIATYAMASEGLDIKTLTTLIMASPKTDVCQSVGRILRVKHASPLVIDIIDPQDVFKAQWMKRQSYYIKQKYKIIMTDSQGYAENRWTIRFDPAVHIKNRSKGEEETPDEYDAEDDDNSAENAYNENINENINDNEMYDIDDNNNITVITEKTAKMKIESKKSALTHDGKCKFKLVL